MSYHNQDTSIHIWCIGIKNLFLKRHLTYIPINRNGYKYFCVPQDRAWRLLYLSQHTFFRTYSSVSNCGIYTFFFSEIFCPSIRNFGIYVYYIEFFFKNIVLKNWILYYLYTFIRVLSALYVYDFFEMFSSIRLFATIPQFKTLEYDSQVNETNIQL